MQLEVSVRQAGGKRRSDWVSEAAKEQIIISCHNFSKTLRPLPISQNSPRPIVPPFPLPPHPPSIPGKAPSTWPMTASTSCSC